MNSSIYNNRCYVYRYFVIKLRKKQPRNYCRVHKKPENYRYVYIFLPPFYYYFFNRHVNFFKIFLFFSFIQDVIVTHFKYISIIDLIDKLNYFSNIRHAFTVVIILFLLVNICSVEFR